jgi:predicted nucleic acid-binding Zn ribbon protein
MSKQKEHKGIRVGYMYTNPDYTTQCKHCGSKAQFLDEICKVRYFACPECGGFTLIKDMVM